MTLHLGDVPASSVLYVPFSSYDAAGASVTMTGFATGDIKIYKDGSTTERASTAGFTLLDTDGTDFDGLTGIHGFSVDLADNTTAGFYAVGSQYWIVISSVTISGQTVNFIAATFRIRAAESIAGKPKVDVDGWNGTAVSAPATAGIPEVNLKNIANAAVSTSTAQLGVNVVNNAGSAITAAAGIQEVKVASIANNAIAAAAIAADAITAAKIADGAIDAATFAAGAINAAAIATDAITAAKIAADAIGASELAADAVTEIQSGLATAAALATVQADTDDIQTRLPAALVSGRIDASVGAMATGVVTATAIAADAITDAKVASDVTIASVTGAVGSVTGNVGGNVVGSVASVTAGVTLAAAAVQAIWDALTSALTTTGSIGKLLVDNINATISSRLASAGYTAPLDAAGTRSAVGLATANLDTQLGAIDDFLDTEIAAIKAKTDNLPSDPADASDVAATLATIAGYIDTEVAAIKAKTDNLPSDPADASDIAAAFTSLNTKVDTIDDFLDTEIAAIKAKTDNLPSDPADQSLIIAATDAIKADTAAVKAKTDDLTFTVANVLDSNVAYVNAVEVTGNGDSPPWGPA